MTTEERMRQQEEKNAALKIRFAYLDGQLLG